jgi:hypothetical protein
MRRLLTIVMAVLLPAAAFAQGGNMGYGLKESDDGGYTSFAEKMLGFERKAEAFNLYLHLAGAYHEDMDKRFHFTGAFHAKHLSLEIKGRFGEHLYYRFRHRLNRSSVGQSEDGFAEATDILMAGWRFNDRFAIEAGKMCQYWGGFEADEHPAAVHAYSEMLSGMDRYRTGFAFLFEPFSGQEFVLNVTDSFGDKFNDVYVAGARTLAGMPVEGVNHPLAWILGWNGRFLGGRMNTRWAAGFSSLAKRVEASAGNYYNILFSVGQQLKLDQFQLYVDYIRSIEDLDCHRYATVDMDLPEGIFVPNVLYQSVVVKGDWQVAPRWNLTGKAMYETASVTQSYDFRNYRTSLGAGGAVEFSPASGEDLRLFVSLFGRAHLPSAASRLPKYLQLRAETGLIYHIKAY